MNVRSIAGRNLDGHLRAVAPFGIGCSLGQYTLTFDLGAVPETDAAAGRTTDLVVVVNGTQRMILRADRGKITGESYATFAKLSSDGLPVGTPTGQTKALKVLAGYCAMGERPAQIRSPAAYRTVARRRGRPSANGRPFSL
jgi:hypothetical protein